MESVLSGQIWVSRRAIADSWEAVSDARTTVVTIEQNVTVEWVHRLDGLKGKQTGKKAAYK